MFLFCKKYSKKLFHSSYYFRVSWGAFLLHFLGTSSRILSMKQYFYIFGFFCILVMPFSSYAEWESIIGSNLGMDFYSRIDDAGESLAQGITVRRLNEKGTYGAFGCNASWLANERIDQKSLEKLKEWNTTILVQLASKKKVQLSTVSESTLRQCLVEKYNNLQDDAYKDQRTLESVGNTGLYSDGDVQNSDYDILHDISRINGVLFKSKYEYKGTKNASAKALSDMLAGKPIAPLFGGAAAAIANPTNSAANNTTSPTGTNSGATNSGATTPLPWAWVCQDTSVASGSVNIGDLFGEDFFENIDASLEGNVDDTGFVFDTSTGRKWTYSAATSAARFGTSQSKDFFHTLPCQWIFCITLNMKGGSQNLLGGGAIPSIESLLEKHIKMMMPISWSDLSQQKMTNNTYQLPFLNIKFKEKIAGARVFMHETPQPKKIVEKEATQTVLDAKFEADMRCAMNEAWLAWDLDLANGSIGAGFNQNRGQTSDNALLAKKPLWPIEMESLKGCYDIRLKDGQKELSKWMSTDLNEIQAFTRAMLNIILEILETDRKLDNLPSK